MGLMPETLIHCRHSWGHIFRISDNLYESEVYIAGVVPDNFPKTIISDTGWWFTRKVTEEWSIGTISIIRFKFSNEADMQYLEMITMNYDLLYGRS